MIHPASQGYFPVDSVLCIFELSFPVTVILLHNFQPFLDVFSGEFVHSKAPAIQTNIARVHLLRNDVKSSRWECLICLLQRKLILLKVICRSESHRRVTNTPIKQERASL